MGNKIEVITSGVPTHRGSYLLKIRLKKAASLSFGAFRGGESIHLPAGDFLYLGSARAEKGASSLGYRLLRHSTRTGDLPPHSIRPALLQALIEAGIAAKLPFGKSLHWHIDHLLDQTHAEITQILALCTGEELESRLAGWLATRPAVSIPASGLGASDHPGSTHLLAIPAGDDWWENTCRAVTDLLP